MRAGNSTQLRMSFSEGSPGSVVLSVIQQERIQSQRYLRLEIYYQIVYD